MIEKRNLSKYKQMLSEKEIANVLVCHMQKLGYVVTTELVLHNKQFKFNELVNRNVSKVRIDVAAYKNAKVTFIEIENGLWVNHPILYRDFAHYMILAFPKEYSSPTDLEQTKMAKLYGIGIVAISRNGSLTSILRPIEKNISKSISQTIISLINKKNNSSKS